MVSFFAPAFRLELMLWLGALLAVADAWWWFRFSPLAMTQVRLVVEHPMSSGLLAAVLIGNYLGLILHELGHAAACVQHDVRHGPVGFCVYLVFPAFYCDVSDCWRTSRRARLAIDGAGVLVSLALADAAAFGYLASGSAALLCLAYLYTIVVLMSLNPFVRLDGYWILSDVTGVPNLMATNRAALAALGRRAVGLSAELPYALRAQASAMQRRACCFYLILCAVAWAGGAAALFRWYLPYVATKLPKILIDLPGRIAQAPSFFGAVQLCVAGAANVAALVGLTVYAAQFCRRAVAWFERWRKLGGEVAA